MTFFFFQFDLFGIKFMMKEIVPFQFILSNKKSAIMTIHNSYRTVFVLKY